MASKVDVKSDSGPTTEIGRPSADVGVQSWAALIDDAEFSPALQWPSSIAVYDRMQTDAQIKGLLMGVWLPIRRFRWQLDPNDAKDIIVKGVAEDLNLPVLNAETAQQPRRRTAGRFSFDRHLADALRALAYGHYPFEQVGEIGDDGLWHITKLAPRPPRTIEEVNINSDGSLKSIKQNVGVKAPEIPAERLVFYVWDKEGANWYGKSMLRSIYRNWLIKDRLLRIDAGKQERNGMGVPVIEAPPGASREQLFGLQQLAQEYRSGDESGLALPNGASLTLQGTQGSLPDTVASINMNNEEMGRNFLAMFMLLGQTRTGARALGETFVDFFAYAQEAVAEWFCETMQADVIEDWVDWNYGPDEKAPQLVYERSEEESLTPDAWAKLVNTGVIHMDENVENKARKRFALPPIDPKKSPYDPETGRITPEPTPEGFGSEPPKPQVGDTGKQTTMPGQGADGQSVKAAAGDGTPIPLPTDRKLRRQPNQAEITASVDYATMDVQVRNLAKSLVTQVQIEQNQQLQDIHDQIVAAKGNLKKLAKIKVSPVSERAILSAMTESANNGIKAAAGEAQRQGVLEPNAPALESLQAQLSARASAIDQLLASSLAQSAATKAIQLTGGTLAPPEVAEQVVLYLKSLSGQYLKQRLGGAVNAGNNSGRMAIMAKNQPTAIYASEILDTNTCGPCTDVDGTQYDSLADAEADYPTGGYAGCEGGDDCRGTLVAVYEESSN